MDHPPTTHHPLLTDDCPLVTVVTATYNLLNAGREASIHQCLESVHHQTYPNIEHLIIDGGSSDGTTALLREYEQMGWVTLHSEPDQGIYDAFNKGLHCAQGKYIAFLNSDDFWHDLRGVEASVRALEEQQADFSYAPYLFLEKGGKTKEKHLPFSNVFCECPCCHQTMFTRTDLLRQSGGFNLRYKVCADRDVELRLVLSGAQPAYVPLCFTSFRGAGLSAVCNQQALNNELHEMYRSHYASLVNSKELELILAHKFPPHFKDALRQRITPSLFRELDQRCRWNSKEQLWHYQSYPTAYGPFGLTFIRLAVSLLNILMPRWHDKLLARRQASR